MEPLKTKVLGTILFLLFKATTLLSWVGQLPNTSIIFDHIEGRIVIEPQKDYLFVQLRYDYVAEEGSPNKIQLFLEKKFYLLRLNCPGLLDFELSRNHMFGDLYHMITIYLKKPLIKGQVLPISMEYECGKNFNHFKGQQFSNTWIEISPNTLEIVPRHISLNKKITFDIELNIHSDYEVLSPATVTFRKGGWNIAASAPCLGFYAVVGKGLTRDIFRKGANQIELVSSNLEETVKDKMVESIDRCLNYYNRTFATNTQKHFVKTGIRPYPKWDAQYACANNYFVTYQEPQQRYFEKGLHHFSNIAHEISHFWWNAADAGSFDNWLNESLAEYSAFLAIRAVYGEKIFKGFLNGCKQVCKNLDSLPVNYRLDFKTHLYKKVPYLLYRLEKQIGRKKFQTLLKKLLEKKVGSTSQFMKELQSLAGTKIAAKFEKKLKS